METTTWYIKLIASILNILIAGIIPLLLKLFTDIGPNVIKLIWIILFLTYNLIFLFVRKDMREPGMLLVNSHWEKEIYSPHRKIIYALLYSLGFSTVFTKVLFPFDILLVNLILIQLPFVLQTGNTLHGYFSGLKTVNKYIFNK